MLVEKCEKCKTCIYRGRLANQNKFCTYILFNKKSRGCHVGEDCIRYEKGASLQLEQERLLLSKNWR